MSDLFKTFAFDLQRFDAVIEPVAGQSGTAEVDWADVSGGGLSSDVDTMYAGGDSSFDGKYFWDDSAKTFVEGLSFAGESGVQISVQYQEYQVTGLSTTGGDSSAIYTFRNITGINTIEFEDAYITGSGSDTVSNPIESNSITFGSGSFWAEGGSAITISSEIPATIDASATGVGTFSALGASFALDSLVIDTQNASVTSISIDEGLLSTADLKSGVSVNLSQSAGIVSHNAVSGVMVSEGGDSAAELSVDKSFAYLVDDETFIEITSGASAAVVSSWGQATRVVPTEKEDGTITVGDASFTYTSGGSAAVIIDSEAGVQGFEFAEVGDKIAVAGTSSTTGYGIRVGDNGNFIDGDLDFAALSKDGYSAELTNVTTTDSGSSATTSYEIDVIPTSNSVALNDSLTLNNNSGSAVLTIDGDGGLSAVKLGVNDEIAGDISDIGGESSIDLYAIGQSSPVGISFDAITGSSATISNEGGNVLKVSGLEDEDEVTINGIDYLFTTAGNNAAISFNANGELDGVDATSGTSVDVSGLSTATNKNVVINDATSPMPTTVATKLLLSATMLHSLRPATLIEFGWILILQLFSVRNLPTFTSAPIQAALLSTATL